jgi:hypothetical protein
MRKTSTASVLHLIGCESSKNLWRNSHLFLEKEVSFLVSLKDLAPQLISAENGFRTHWILFDHSMKSAHSRQRWVCGWER